MMHEPPRDIPFWPDWLNDRLGPGHAKTLVIARRLTPRLRDQGYTIAITPKQNAKLQAEHAAEVREAVRRRLCEIVGLTRFHVTVSPAQIVEHILADPAIAILTDHGDRRKA